MNHRQRTNRVVLQHDHIVGHLIPELERAHDVLRRHTPDGRIASPSFNAGSRGTDTTSTTERHALNPDPEQQLVERVFTTWTAMYDAIKHCVFAIAQLDATATPKPLREPSLPPPCECCGDTSLRIEGGLCAERCAPSWRAWRADRPNPDRTRWLTERRKRLATPTDGQPAA